MSNEQLEELMKGHYQVQEVKYLANKKGKGAGVDSDLNTDPFGFNNKEEESAFGKLSSSSSSTTAKQGLAAGSEDKDNQDEDSAFAVANAF